MSEPVYPQTLHDARRLLVNHRDYDLDQPLPSEEHERAARLIHAAPDMAQALRLLLESHERSCCGVDCYIQGVDLGKAALRKAGIS